MQLFWRMHLNVLTSVYPFATRPYNYELCASSLLEIVDVRSLKNSTQVSPSSGVVSSSGRSLICYFLGIMYSVLIVLTSVQCVCSLQL